MRRRVVTAPISPDPTSTAMTPGAGRSFGFAPAMIVYFRVLPRDQAAEIFELLPVETQA